MRGQRVADDGGRPTGLRGPSARAGVPVTLDRTVERFARWCPPSLISRAAVDRIGRLAARLPASLSSLLYFECRLGAAEEGVDFSLAIEGQGREILAADHAVRLDPELAASGVWPVLARLSRAWPRRAHARQIERLWLEFDLQATPPPAALLEPGLFVDVRPAAPAGTRPRDFLALASVVLEPLAPGFVSVARGALTRCLERLPEGASVAAFGAFPARRRESLRICLRGVGRSRLAGFLRTVGWPGAPAELDRRLDLWDRAVEGASEGVPDYVHLDVGASLAPQVGLELGMSRSAQARGRLSETRFLDRLVAAGLCGEARRRGLDAWPGVRIERLAHELWPSLAVRRVNHVKLIHDPDAGDHAKAYLSARHLPRPARGPARSTGPAPIAAAP